MSVPIIRMVNREYFVYFSFNQFNLIMEVSISNITGDFRFSDGSPHCIFNWP